MGESIEKGSEFPQKVSSDTWRVYLIIHSLIMWNNLMHISDLFHYFIFIGVYCVIVVCILFVDRQDPTTLWKQVSVTLWTHRFFPLENPLNIPPRSNLRETHTRPQTAEGLPCYFKRVWNPPVMFFFYLWNINETRHNLNKSNGGWGSCYHLTCGVK